jgi:hypothetical protein
MPYKKSEEKNARKEEKKWIFFCVWEGGRRLSLAHTLLFATLSSGGISINCSPATPQKRLFFLYKKNRMKRVKKPNKEEVLYMKDVAGEK